MKPLNDIDERPWEGAHIFQKFSYFFVTFLQYLIWFWKNVTNQQPYCSRQISAHMQLPALLPVRMNSRFTERSLFPRP